MGDATARSKAAFVVNTVIYDINLQGLLTMLSVMVGSPLVFLSMPNNTSIPILMLQPWTQLHCLTEP